MTRKRGAHSPSRRSARFGRPRKVTTAVEEPMTDDLFTPTNSARPTLYLSNWSSHRTPGMHGPGPKLTIMCMPRQWEKGDGTVRALCPSSHDLVDCKAGRITVAEYRRRYELALTNYGPGGVLVTDYHTDGWLAPHTLKVLPATTPAAAVFGPHDKVFDTPAGPAYLVPLGSTLCCSCAVAKAAAGECHRAWAAPFLVRAGWRVVLDGEEVT